MVESVELGIDVNRGARSLATDVAAGLNRIAVEPDSGVASNVGSSRVLHRWNGHLN